LFSCILALPPFCSLSCSSPSVGHQSPLLLFLALCPLSGLFLYLQIEYRCFAYNAMQFVAGRTPIFLTFQSLFPPFMLTAACSLPMSLLTRNHIKTPTIWLSQARQLWPHSFIFSLCAHFLSPLLDFDFYSAVTTLHSRLPYIPIFTPVPNFADSLMHCHSLTHSCWRSSSLTPAIPLHVCSSMFSDSSILGSILQCAFLF